MNTPNYPDFPLLAANALASATDITPPSEKEWKMWLRACKVLGIDRDTFIALSALHGTTERDSSNAWKEARQTYFDHDAAARKFLFWASRAGLDCRPTATPSPFHAAVPKSPKTPPAFLPKSLLEASGAKVESTALFRFLSSLWPDDTRNAFALYQVGGSSFRPQPAGLASAFPLMDSNSNLVDFQLSSFDQNGHGVKLHDGSRAKSWAIPRMVRSGSLPPDFRRAPWPFFGQHLLSRFPDLPVAIVEAPKTALVGAICYPQYLWLSCISLSWLDSAIPSDCLKGRSVSLFPDRDGTALWREKARQMAARGIQMAMNPFVEQNPGEPKDDLADIVIRAVTSS